MQIWRPGMVINRDTVYSAWITLMTKDGSITRKIEIKDKMVDNKPDDIDILGDNTEYGFIIKGIQLNKIGINISCDKHMFTIYKDLKFWNSIKCPICKNKGIYRPHKGILTDGELIKQSD